MEALTFVLIASLWYVISSTWIVTALRHYARKTNLNAAGTTQEMRDFDLAMERAKDPKAPAVEMKANPLPAGWTIGNAGGGADSAATAAATTETAAAEVAGTETAVTQV